MWYFYHGNYGKLLGSSIWKPFQVFTECRSSSNSIQLIDLFCNTLFDLICLCSWCVCNSLCLYYHELASHFTGYYKILEDIQTLTCVFTQKSQRLDFLVIYLEPIPCTCSYFSIQCWLGIFHWKEASVLVWFSAFFPQGYHSYLNSYSSRLA